jgi:Mce-associated membrane protein
MKSPGLAAMTALAAVSVLVAAWFGWSWWSAAQATVVTRGQDRDTVLAAADDALTTLNTVDYHDPGAAVDRWIQVTTGELGKTLSGDRQLQLDRATASRTVASARVNQAAVAALNPDAGTARVIAVLDVQLSTNGAPSVPSRARLNASLTRTDAGWKVDSVQAAS